MKLYINVEWRLDSEMLSDYSPLQITEKSWACDDTQWDYSYDIVEELLQEWIISSLQEGFTPDREAFYRSVLEVEISYTQDYYGEVDMDWGVTLKKMSKLEEIPFTFVEDCINILPQTE